MTTITCYRCGREGHRDTFRSIAGITKVTFVCEDEGMCHARAKKAYITNTFTNRRKDTPMSNDNPFGEYVEPTITDADEYRARDHYGNSAIVKVLEYKDSIVTPNSPNGAPGVIVDVYDLNKKAVFRNVLMMTGALVDGFRPHVAKAPVVIRWEKRKANSGRDYPTAVPATDEAITFAKKVYADGDPFAPEFGTVEEVPF